MMERKLKAVPKNTTHDDEDMDLGMADEHPPLVPEGDYEVSFIGASERFFSFGGMRILLRFQIITPGEHRDKMLFMGCRISPKNGRTTLAQSSKIVRAITVALGHPPSRTDRLTTKVFRAKYFRAIVETVTVDPKKKALPKDAWYSTIRMLMEKTAG